MRNIRAGALRTPVFLGRPLVTKDAAGGESLSWEEFATWALIEPVGGREWQGTAAVKDAVDARISVRMHAGWIPDARYRVRDAQTGALYNVVSALPFPKFGSVECLAKTSMGNSDGR